MGSTMILPDYILRSRMNQHWDHSGIDSLENCLNKKHFEEYPHKVSYVYNSRGFRDAEWPEDHDQLQNAIWCVGDSFTVGLGSPYEHIWPQRLQQALGQRTINVSMDGASNNWISRRACGILQTVAPKTMVIQWSYIARRELDTESALNLEWNRFYSSIRESGWPDCDRDQRSKLHPDIVSKINNNYGGFNEQVMLNDESRILQYSRCSVDDDVDNTLNCIGQVQQCAGKTVIIHSFIPFFVSRNKKGVIESQISGLVIPEIVRLDVARDGHHYDVITSDRLVAQIQQLLI